MNDQTPNESAPLAAEKGDDPIAVAILDLLKEAAPGARLAPQQVARSYAETRAKRGDPPDLWRRYLTAVRQQALYLARRGRIDILRKGKPVDAKAPVKGLIKLTLPAKD